MLKKALALTAAALALAFTPSAQENCSTFDVQVTPGPELDMDTLTVDIQGSAPLRPTWVIGGLMDKPTTIVYGSNLILEVGISVPVLNAYLGLTDENGDYLRSYLVPTDVNLTLYTQAVTLDFERLPSGLMSFDFCTSNVLTLQM